MAQGKATEAAEELLLTKYRGAGLGPGAPHRHANESVGTARKGDAAGLVLGAPYTYLDVAVLESGVVSAEGNAMVFAPPAQADVAFPVSSKGRTIGFVLGAPYAHADVSVPGSGAEAGKRRDVGLGLATAQYPHADVFADEYGMSYDEELFVKEFTTGLDGLDGMFQYSVVAEEVIYVVPSSPLPDAVQVSIDDATGAKHGDPIAVGAKAAASADARGGRGGNLVSTVVGIAAASSAVTMVAAGGVSPPLAFGLFVLLLGALSLAVSGVRRA